MKKRKLPKTLKEVQAQIALGTLESDDTIKLLKSKKTSSDVIEILYDVKVEGYQNYQKRELIPKHPNTPASVLSLIFHKYKMAQKYSDMGVYEVDILAHPSLPLDLLDKILNKILNSTKFTNYPLIDTYHNLFKAIENPNTSSTFLKALSTHENVTVRTIVAGNPNTPPEILETLSLDVGNRYNWRPQKSVASNPSTPPHVLEALTEKTSAGVQQKIAGNPNTPINTLKKIAATKNKQRCKAKGIALSTLFDLGELVFKNS